MNNHPPILTDLETLPLINRRNDDEYYEDIIDLDNFFINMYDYYLNKGYYPSISKRIIHVIQYLLLIIIFIFYNHIDFNQSLLQKQLVFISMSYGIINVCIIILSLVGFIMITSSTVLYIQNMYNIKQFYQTRLKLTDEEIQNMYWNNITYCIVNYQQQNKFYKIHPSLSEYQITNHIMRIDNLIIALIQKNVITTSIRIPIINYRIPYFPKLYIYCIKRGIIDSVFNERKQFEINTNIDSIIIQKLTLYSIGIIVLSPFILIILTLFFVFRYFDDFRQNKYTSIRTRKWSRYSRWLFRKPNELYHILHKRLSIAYIYSDLYINNFSNELIVICARFVAFICGTLLTTLLALSVVDEDFLHVHLYSDKTSLWFIGMCGIILSMCRVSIKDEYHIFTPEKYMNKVIQYIQYYPVSWQNELHTNWVKTEFTMLFQHKLVYILEELSSIILVPYILHYKVKYEVGNIVKFLNQNVKKDTAYNLGYIYTHRDQEAFQNLEQSIHEDFITLLTSLKK